MKELERLAVDSVMSLANGANVNELSVRRVCDLVHASTSIESDQSLEARKWVDELGVWNVLALLQNIEDGKGESLDIELSPLIVAVNVCYELKEYLLRQSVYFNLNFYKTYEESDLAIIRCEVVEALKGIKRRGKGLFAECCEFWEVKGDL